MNNREEREMKDARAFLRLSKTGLTSDKIAEITGLQSKEIERLIALAKQSKK
jgi:hypothetical protein